MIGNRKIDYLVINHMEPDHSGAIELIRKYYPEIKIVANKKTFGMIEGFYGITTNEVEVKNGSKLSLGRHELNFVLTPMVHWPETMVTLDTTSNVLFSGDAFGCFGALNGGIIDSDINCDTFWLEMVRYYSNIVGKYGVPVQNALKKLEGVQLDYICSTHGPVWHEHISKVIDIYDRLSRYEGEPGVVIAYGSMYGNTEQLAERIACELAEQGVRPIVMHNLTTADMSMVVRDVFKYDTLLVGSPTYNAELFPEVEHLLRKIEARCVPHRNFGFFGSFCWAGAAVRRMKEFAERMKWEPVCEPVEMKQGFDARSYDAARTLAGAVAARFNER